MPFRILLFLAIAALSTSLSAADSPQAGFQYSHNNISFEKNLPESFEPGRRDPATGEITEAGGNVRWAVRLGPTNYAVPTVAGGKVLIGTSNCEAYDSVLAGDRGVLLCFDEKTGEFLWKLALPKYTDKRFFDFPNTGMVSPPTVIDDRIYLVSNRGEVLCLDLNGMSNGNDGPFQDEGKIMTGPEQEPYTPTAKDADIIWCFDMLQELGIRQHDAANASIVAHDGLLYLNSGNGLNDTYTAVENPEAPSLLVIDAETGRPLAQDDRWVGNDVVHGQWSSPSIGTVGEKTYVFFGGGNARLYAFEALKRDALWAEVEKTGSLSRISPKWSFNGQQGAREGEEAPFRVGKGSPTFTCQPAPVFCDGRVYAIFGTEGWVGEKPRKSEVVCIDITDDLSGDITKMAKIWSTGLIDGGVLTAPTVAEGLTYFADRKGNCYCRDAASGELYWTEKLRGDIWASPLLGDGKIYIGTDKRTLFVLKTGKVTGQLAEITLPDNLRAPLAAANSTLFVPCGSFLYAVEKE